MQKNNKKTKIILFALLFFCSCADFRRVMYMTAEQRMNEVKANHHEFCTSRGLEAGKDPLKTELYWRCRVILAQNRLTFHSFNIRNLDRNAVNYNYVEGLKSDFHLAYEKSNQSRNNILNDLDHNKCVLQGYDLNSLDKVEVEKYLSCRRRLAAELQLVPPYNKISYYDRPFDSYSHLFGLDKKLDEGIAQSNEMAKKYPNCLKSFNIESEEFLACKNDYDSQVKCLKNIESAKQNRDFEERQICQKLTYIRFSDSLIKEDRFTKTEINERNKRADIAYNNSLASLGLSEQDIEKFYFGDKIEENKKTDEKNKKNFNSKNELYSRIEVAKLRQKFYSYCIEDANQRLEGFVNDLTGQCNMIVVKWQQN